MFILSYSHSDSEDVGLHVEEYLNAMSSALAERR